MFFIVKVTVTAVIVVLVSEISKRSSVFAAVVASLPLTSILAMIWLYRETSDIQKVISLSNGIFWAVLPSLAFFLVLPRLLKAGIGFSWAMAAACAIMFGTYSIFLLVINKI